MTTEINLKDVEAKAAEFGYDLLKVKAKIKSIQTQKHRIAQQKGRSNYEQLMLEKLAEERLLVEVRQLLDPKPKKVTQYEQADVDMLDYDQTAKAIKSIQSKKTLTRWLTDVDGDNDEYRNACRIEQMLQKHKEKLDPYSVEYIRKTDLQTVIDTIESSGELSQEKILELLKNLM